MVDKRAIRKYKIRRDGRLKKRGLRLDADWEENKHPRAKDGKFTSGSGGGAASGENNPKSGSSIKPRGSSPELKKAKSAQGFRDSFMKTRGEMPAAKRWRVSADYSAEDYEDMEKYVSEDGSTFALHGTDIVSVAAGPRSKGRDIMADAVAAGGNKLDAYAGIYGFYQKCGFEPVSWTEWDDDYAEYNPDWLEANGYTADEWKAMDKKPDDRDLAVPREPIVFFKYTGEINTEPLEDFKKRVKPQVYEKAQKERDDLL